MTSLMGNPTVTGWIASDGAGWCDDAPRSNDGAVSGKGRLGDIGRAIAWRPAPRVPRWPKSSWRHVMRPGHGADPVRPEHQGWPLN
jgi:hypothetical protein